MHEFSTEARHLALWLLRSRVGEPRDAAALAAAAEHSCENLRRRLMPLIGATGCTALFRRALYLAQGESPALADLAIDEGVVPYLAGGAAFAAAHAADPALVEGALVAILAHFIALLDTFIGEALTRRVLGEQRSAPAAAEESMS
jgi:hypothetical protein